MSSPVIIIGSGYTGGRLAQRLIDEGFSIWLTRRHAAEAHADAKALGPRATGVAVTLPDEVDALAGAPHRATWIVLAPPTGDDGSGELPWLAAATAADAAHVIYVSSTGVYGAADGALVNEDAPLDPASDTGRARVASEAAVRGSGLPSTILRPAGIYGPGRGLAERVRAGRYRVLGSGDSYVCRIHVDDLVSALLAAVMQPVAHGRIYNVADNLPSTSADVADGVAEVLGLPHPPRTPVEEVTASVRAMLTSDRRIDNARLRSELGLTLRYPSWREGLAAELATELATEQLGDAAKPAAEK